MFRVVIPARRVEPPSPASRSSTLPGGHCSSVYARGCRSQAIEVLIATEDERIAQLGRTLGATVVMTLPEITRRLRSHRGGRGVARLAG